MAAVSLDDLLHVEPTEASYLTALTELEAGPGELHSFAIGAPAPACRGQVHTEYSKPDGAPAGITTKQGFEVAVPEQIRGFRNSVPQPVFSIYTWRLA